MRKKKLGQELYEHRENVIVFYKTGDDFGIFSNFYSSGIYAQGKYWPTVEHYFQAQKFCNELIKEKIRKFSSPMDAAKEGRSRNNKLREDWEKVKDNVMRFAVLEKFKQNDDARAILLSTENHLIIEHTVNDNYWGDGGDGSGKNMLGTILMETRELLSSSN